jgi:hypothetical protein
MEEVHQVFDLVRLENISERRHSGATVVDLMLDLLLFKTLTDSTEIWPEIPAQAIHAMTMLTSLFMKEDSSRHLTLA